MERLPVVSFERLLGSRLPMVSSDHRQGGQLAAQELFSCSCRNSAASGAMWVTYLPL